MFCQSGILIWLVFYNLGMYRIAGKCGGIDFKMLIFILVIYIYFFGSTIAEMLTLQARDISLADF